ncbi:glutathione S-transferase [Emericellopsis cladophorae]|uniref:Glutathione S-transferase n=1 Tax=Emericellopsis cladophorae TaxID=2686198 RepID=A0A9P9XWY4_9HYPO|nr:glutathione S-transferase [Emericellopsis cladophorae]KAI6779168.1 glutathione S-transferase [Emericellopsis cladophorae]
MASTDLPHVTLYWLDKSRSQRIVWLLEALELPYTLELFHREKTMLAPAELMKIHPLGKSPVIKVTPANGGASQTLAESGWMTQYLVENTPTGAKLMPTKYKEGQEGQMGGETEEYMRYMYILHYCEGSLMPILVMTIVINALKSPQVPFFIRPITGAAANRILSTFIFPNAQKHMGMLEGMLKSSSGRYLCGDRLTAADILMSFPLIAARGRLDEIGTWEGGSWAKAFPTINEYVDRLEAEEGYKKSVQKVEELEGRKFQPSL